MKAKDLLLTKGPVALPIVGAAVLWAGGFLVGKGLSYWAFMMSQKDQQRFLKDKVVYHKASINGIKQAVIGGGVSVVGAGMIGTGVGLGQHQLNKAYAALDEQALAQRETKDGVETVVDEAGENKYTFAWLEQTDEDAIELLNWLQGAEFYNKRQLEKHGYITLDTISDSIGKNRIPGGGIKGISTKKPGSIGKLEFEMNEVAIDGGLTNVELTIKYDGVIAKFM